MIGPPPSRVLSQVNLTAPNRRGWFTVVADRKDRAAPVAVRRRRRTASGLWAAFFVAPFFVGIGVFYLWPIVQTAYFSFTKWGAFGGSEFIGTANYERLVSDPAVPGAILHTVVYTVIVLVAVPIAAGLASLLNRPGLRFARVFRVLYFLPYLTMPVAVALVWQMIFNGNFGIVNGSLAAIGIDGPAWLTTPGLALVTVSFVGAWMFIGFDIIILSAGMRAIPSEVYEAASLDGASRTRQFWRITLPLLSPSIFFLVVINVIAGFQVFDLLFAMLGTTNPVMGDTQSLVYLFYSESFLQNDKGYGAAIAIFILLLICAVTFVQFRLQRKWVTYA